jgi:hypothetical protein
MCRTTRVGVFKVFAGQSSSVGGGPSLILIHVSFQLSFAEMERIPRGGGSGSRPISATAARVAAAREAAASAGRKAAASRAFRRPVQDESSILMKLMRSYQNVPDLSVRRRSQPKPMHSVRG